MAKHRTPKSPRFALVPEHDLAVLQGLKVDRTARGGCGGDMVKLNHRTPAIGGELE